MARKPVDPLKAKEQRQKKILIGLAPLFLIVLVLTVPKTLKRMHASSAPPPAPPATTTTETTGTPTTATPLPISLIGGGTATTTGGLAGDAPATASVGQLASFGRFASKDPFSGPVALPGTTTPAPKTGVGDTGKTSTGKTPTGKTPTGPPSSPPAPPTPAPTSAVIAVNGVKASVTVDSDFPTAASTDPQVQSGPFHLVSLTQSSAKVSIVGGSYATGDSTLTITISKPVTLMNKSDGTRYTLQLFPQGTPVPTTTETATTPAAPPSGSTSTTTTASTTTGTTASTTTTGTTTGS
jgi:hypothetical protein